MKQSRIPILVTGSHRSGTTWIGKSLALAPNTGYIHEPFNIGIKFPVVDAPFRYWFQYITDENSIQYQSILDKIFNFEYPLVKNLKKAMSARNVAHVLSDQAIFVSNRIRNNVPIIKDPIAFFSSEWLSMTYGIKVLVSIRHPAAFCSSIKIKNWNFDFNNFLNQPLLMQRYLATYYDQICEFAREEKPIIDQAVLLWNCIHSTVKIYQQEHPEWIFVRHEDLSSNPVEEFNALYDRLDLKFTSKAAQGILETSGSHNPKEQQSGNEFKRDSLANITNWKDRLSHEEVALIKIKTKSVACAFYQDSEW